MTDFILPTELHDALVAELSGTQEHTTFDPLLAEGLPEAALGLPPSIELMSLPISTDLFLPKGVLSELQQRAEHE